MAGGRDWAPYEDELLTEKYNNHSSIPEIASILGRTYGSVASRAQKIGLTKKIIRNNNANFKAPYQDYNWLYQKAVVEHKTAREIAEENGYKTRTIEKWLYEKHGISNRTIKDMIKLNEKQKMLVIAGTLGDGHIPKDIPVYIESHAEDEKDYLMYKYEILKNINLKEPTYKPPGIKIINGKEYPVKASYRITTREISEFATIRSMSKSEKIQYLDDYGLSLHILDDGSRSASNWEICLAEWSESEKQEYIAKLEEYGITSHLCTDERYVRTIGEGTKKCDEMICANMPNDLDIIKKKFKNVREKPWERITQ